MSDPATDAAPSFATLGQRWLTRSYPPEWRGGQAIFNLLHEVRPDLADELRGSDIDPFYRDRNIVAAWAWIAERWSS